MELQRILKFAANATAGRNMRKLNNQLEFLTVSRQISSSSTGSSTDNEEGTSYVGMVVPREEVIRYIADSLVKVGANKEDAVIVGEHLFTADYRGHFSHGMNRMEMYVRDVEKKLTDPKARPVIITDHQAVATVDGKNGFGQVIGNFSMRLAMRKAQEFGIGMVSCRGSNHYGIAGYYSLLAMRENLIGFSCTNTSPLMAPTRSKVAALGTNPISLGVRGSDDDEFLLDMATTSVALGKIELAIRKGDPIPRGWALGEDGRPTSDGKVAFKTGCLMPLGGEEISSGYKGYGLALMVEILSGILSGSNFGPNIRKWEGGEGIANLGHCFIAIDPEKFIPGWKLRLDKLLKQLRELPLAGDENILVPGDPERKHMMKVDQDGGISYHINQIKASQNFAQKLGIRPLKFVGKKNRAKL